MISSGVRPKSLSVRFRTHANAPTMTQHPTADLVDVLVRVLEREPAVVVAYLFGSLATGSARPGSDLDLGIAYSHDLEAKEREAARRRLLGALGDALGSLGERADLVDLERSGTTIALRAIHDGRRLLARDEGVRVALEARIARRYDDEAPRRALFRRAAIEAARGMGERSDGR